MQVDRGEGEVGRHDGDVSLCGGQHRFDAETNLGQEPNGEEIWKEEDPFAFSARAIPDVNKTGASRTGLLQAHERREL